MDEICRDCSPNILWVKWQCKRILFTFIRAIIITFWNNWSRAFCKNSQRQNTVNYFCKKLHLRCLTGLSIRPWLSKVFFLFLSIVASTLDLLIIFLIWLVFYLRISTSYCLFRSNKVMFQSCQIFTMRNQTVFDKSVLASLWLNWIMATSGFAVSTSYIFIYITKPENLLFAIDL